MDRIIEKFSIIEDFRCECNVNHKLVNILFLIMCAVLSGIDNTNNIVLLTRQLNIPLSIKV